MTAHEQQAMGWVGDIAGARARICPHAPAIYDATSEQRYSFAEIDERANRVGCYLRDTLKLRRGDKICFIGRNGIEPIDLYMAAGKTGIILAPLSYRLAKPELDDIMRRIQPQALFYEQHFASLVETLMPPASVKDIVDYGTPDSSYQHRVISCDATDVNVALRLQDTFLYVHTGGTTATPKICVIPFRQMAWNAYELMATAGWGGYNRNELISFPFFHIGGWNTLNAVFSNGGESIILREFDPKRILQVLQQERVCHFGGVEAMLQFLIAVPEFDAADLSALKSISTAGAPCAPEVMEPFWQRGIAVTQTYGLTEAGPSNFGFIPEHVEPELMRQKSGSIGKPMMFCDCQIVDPDSRQPVPRGEIGVLCLRSAHSFDGYLDDPIRTAQILSPEGWIYSGDLALQDSDGFVYIKGRVDNMFISGGENVSPEEIELALMKHPHVSQSICVGVPDPRWGQVGVAKVVLKEAGSVDGSELLTHCMGLLAKFKLPREILIGDQVPLTGAGKLDRNAFRTELLQRQR